MNLQHKIDRVRVEAASIANHDDAPYEEVATALHAARAAITSLLIRTSLRRRGTLLARIVRYFQTLGNALIGK